MTPESRLPARFARALAKACAKEKAAGLEFQGLGGFRF